MGKRIFYQTPEGRVTVKIPRGALSASLKTVPANAINVVIVDESVIPSDRTFRDAWVHGGDRPVVHMGKARQIHMGRIREIRNRELDLSDKDMAKAQDQGDAVQIAAIKARRQSLRDIPQSFDLTVAQTPEALKALWPAGLPKK